MKGPVMKKTIAMMLCSLVVWQEMERRNQDENEHMKAQIGSSLQVSGISCKHSEGSGRSSPRETHFHTYPIHKLSLLVVLVRLCPSRIFRYGTET